MIKKCPIILESWSLDEVAECLSGLSRSTCDELWELVVAAERKGTDKPLGGDGSDGTTEIPIISSGEYDTDLVAGWPRLSDKAREEICRAAEML